MSTNTVRPTITDAPATTGCGYLCDLLTFQIPAQEIQGSLTRFQARPIIGPLIGSPVKALYSIAQTILGIALCILFRPIAKLTNFSILKRVAKYGGHQMALGVSGLVTSVRNFSNCGGPIENSEVVTILVRSQNEQLGRLAQGAADQLAATQLGTLRDLADRIAMIRGEHGMVHRAQR